MLLAAIVVVAGLVVSVTLVRGARAKRDEGPLDEVPAAAAEQGGATPLSAGAQAR
jgi:hypothetical protein